MWGGLNQIPMVAKPRPSGKPRAILECALALALLVASAPLTALLAAVVRLKWGRPVLFRQTRAGLGGRPFVLYKFRTMSDARDESGSLLPDARRLSGLGRWLRSTSLDELPELWNVVRGDMAFVGPRPLPVTYLDRYTAEEARRHDVRPGLTGWAQVNGRNSVPWDERLAMDIWYVNNRSLALDLKIAALTLRLLVRRTGINSEGHATMHELRPPP